MILSFDLWFSDGRIVITSSECHLEVGCAVKIKWPKYNIVARQTAARGKETGKEDNNVAIFGDCNVE